MHIFTYSSMSPAFSPKTPGRAAAGTDKWALLPADSMVATIRKISVDGQSRIVIRTHFTYDPGIRSSQRRLAKVAARQRRSFAARFPALGAVPMEFSWAGALCLSRNHVPAFGEGEPGLYAACCENGSGTAHTTRGGL